MAQLGDAKPQKFRLLARLAAFIGLAVLMALVFQTLPGHRFVNWDDPHIFPEFLSGRWLTRQSLAWAMAMDGGDWQPVARLLILVQAASTGISAKATHTASLLCHGINALLLFLVVEKILLLKTPSTERSELRTLAACFLAVCVVMLHPLRVEPVSWASSQSTLWCTTLVLLALLSFLGLIRHPQSKGYASVTVFLFLTALFVKPISVVADFWFFVLAWYARPQKVEGRENYPPALPTKKLVLLRETSDRPSVIATVRSYFLVWTVCLICALAAILIIMLTVYMRQKYQDLSQVKVFSLVDVMPRAGYAFGYYIQKTLLPTGLSPFVGLPIDFAVRFRTTMVGLAVFLALLFWGRRRQGVILSLGAFVIGLAPALGILKVGRFVAADRYTYVASMALAPLLAEFFLRCTDRPNGFRKWITWGIWLLAIAALGTFSAHESKAWQDSRSLWQHALDRGGDTFADVHSNFGGALESEGKYPEALAAYGQAIVLDPLFPDAHIGRAVVLYRLGRLDEAIREAEIAVKYGGDYAVAWQNLAAFLVAGKRYAEARPVVEKALNIAPDSSALHYLSGQLYAEAGNYTQALHFFEQATALQHDWVDPQIAQGAMLVLLGQKAAGRALLEKIVAAYPESQAARATLEALLQAK
jgi:tetratricopeptide (TPR) repeat protein